LPENKPAPQTISRDALPVKDPVAFLAKCLDQYNQRGVEGYRLTMQKQERVNDVLQPTEEIEVYFREKPHSVLMKWVKGQRLASRVLYVEGENNGKLLAKPAGLASALLSAVERDPEGPDAKQSGRYPVTQFGLKKTAERSLKGWSAAQKNGTLKFEYLGVRKVPEAGGRLCYALRRTCDKPEEDGQVEATLYIDKELGLQVGSITKGVEGKLLGEYFYRDIQFNPEFKKGQFERAALSQ
jgi:uncharacterized protein DUF1571